MEFGTKREYFHNMAEQRLIYNAEAEATKLFEDCMNACEQAAMNGEFEAECPDSVLQLFGRGDKRSRAILKRLDEKLAHENLSITEQRRDRFFESIFVIEY